MWPLGKQILNYSISALSSLLPGELKWEEMPTQQMVSSRDQARPCWKEDGYLGSLVLPKEIPSKRQAVIFYGCSFFLSFLRAVLVLFGKKLSAKHLLCGCPSTGGSLDTVFSDL